MDQIRVATVAVESPAHLDLTKDPPYQILGRILHVQLGEL
jgi:hypothetical protein